MSEVANATTANAIRMSLASYKVFYPRSIKNEIYLHLRFNREVSEWLKEHAWKVCKRETRFVGSNPILSAICLFL